MGNRKCRHCGKKNKDTESYFPHHVPSLKLAAFCSHEHFELYMSSQSVCEALIKKGDAIRRKDDNKAYRERKKAIKPTKYWQDKLQALVNQWIVHVRDADKPCCTCGTRNPHVKYDAGHYHAIGRGGADRRRFEITNIHKQCSVNCNQHGAGMRAEYREFIKAVYGEDHLEWLDGEHNFPLLKEQFPHWTDYEAEIIRYRKLLREAGVTPSA